MAPITVDGLDIDDATIDGDVVDEITMDGDVVYQASAILDGDVYLHDDWGDNKLTDRDGSGTTTHNGEEGVYRPEWTIDGTTPTVENETLTIGNDDGIYTDINLNLNEEVKWEFSNVDVSDSDTGSNNESGFTLFAETTSRAVSNRTFDDSYWLNVRRDPDGSSDHEIIFVRTDDGDFNSLIEGTFNNGDDFTVTRSDNGEWELIVNGTSIGTTTDTTYTNPQVIGFGGRPNDTTLVDVGELKVS